MDKKSFLKTCADFLTGALDKKQFIALLIYGSLTIFLELMSYIVGGVFSIIASRLWIAGFILFVLAFIGIVCKQIKADSENKVSLLPILFLVVVVFFAFQIGNYGFSDIGYESPRQVVSGLDALEETDWNYTGWGFTGYPIKQYILNALPSVFLGRSFFALSLGFAFPFLMGLILLFIELRKFLKAVGADENFAILPILMIAFCPYVDEFYYIFEQSMTPISFCMIIVALFLRVVRKPSLLSFVLLFWNVCMLPFMYTPALALMGLVLVLFVYHGVLVLLGKSFCSVYEGKMKVYYSTSLFVAAAAPVICFACTLLKEREDRFISGYGEDGDPEKIKEFFTAFKTFFIQGDSAFFGVFGAFVLIYMVCALTLRLKRYHIIVSLWCIATSFFSFMLPGVSEVYNFYYKTSVLAQRNLVIIPVLAVCMLTAVIECLQGKELHFRKDLLSIVCVSFFLFGFNSLFYVHKVFTDNNYIQNMKYIIKYCEEVTEYHGCNYDDEFVLALHFNNGYFSNPYNYTQYFFPNAKVCTFTAEEYSGVSIYDVIYPRFCFSESAATQNYYNASFKNRSFHNYRYGEDTTLYFFYMDPKYDYIDQYDEAFIEEHNLRAVTQ